MLTLATATSVCSLHTAVVSKLESCSRVVLPQAAGAAAARGGGEQRGGGKNYDNYLSGLASQSRQSLHSTAVGK